MLKKTYSYLLNFPSDGIKRLFKINTVLYILFIIIHNKVKLPTGIFYLFAISLSWTGLGFILIVQSIKLFNAKSVNKWAKTIGLICAGVEIGACYIGPVVLYFLAKKTDHELELLKQLMTTGK